jgi:hypothetical protein
VSADWTPAPWFLDGDSFGILARKPGFAARYVAEAFENVDNIFEVEAQANARRIVAAINATKDFTTEGLEEIAQKGLTLQLAMRATWMMQSEKLESAAGMEKALEKADATIREEDIDTGEYPLSRGD